MTVDLKLHRTIVLSRSAAARLEQVAVRAPDERTAAQLRQGARVLNTVTGQLEQRLQELLEAEPSYQLAGRTKSE